jgi:succinate dehydrogenase / fumarate reductase membrane anchor subunit
MNFRDPLATARGLGSAKSGYQHWRIQRVTAVVLALFTPAIVFGLAKYGISDIDQIRVFLTNPLFSGIAVIYLLALFWHAKLGMQVVIEDYVHNHGLEIALQLSIKIIYSLASVVALIAIARLVLTS